MIKTFRPFKEEEYARQSISLQPPRNACGSVLSPLFLPSPMFHPLAPQTPLSHHQPEQPEYFAKKQNGEVLLFCQFLFEKWWSSSFFTKSLKHCCAIFRMPHVSPPNENAPLKSLIISYVSIEIPAQHPACTAYLQQRTIIMLIKFEISPFNYFLSY